MGYPIANIDRYNEAIHLSQIKTQLFTFPSCWLRYLVNADQKLQFPVLLVLAEIYYWYRPILVYDKKTNEIIDYQNKYKGHLLQKSYKELAEKLNLTKCQIRNAFNYLEEKKLIFREFKNFYQGSTYLTNVMYIGLYTENLLEIIDHENLIEKTSLQESNQQEKNLDNSLKVESATSSLSKKIEEVTKISGGGHKNMTTYTKTSSKTTSYLRKSKKENWSLTFSQKEKIFLDELLAIKPYQGDPIQMSNATWWIKSYGIDAIKTALNVYWQRVNRAKEDPNFEAPRQIGACIRTALDKKTPVYQQLQEKQDTQDENQADDELKPKIQSTIVNDPTKNKPFQLSKNSNIFDSKSKFYQKSKTSFSQKFNQEEIKYLDYLLKYEPLNGEKIQQDTATWWIKKFGIAKIKIAMQVYLQQIEKAKKNASVPLPNSIGAYIRHALNANLQPCRETDKRNQLFAEKLKRQFNWSELILTEKYCRVENTGKDWYYHMPEELFQKSLKEFYENFFGNINYTMVT